MRSRLIVAALVNILILGIGVAFACGDYYDPYSDASFFRPTIHTQSTYLPYHYISYESFFTDETGADDQNIALWRKYTHDQATAADIDSFVYRYSMADAGKICNHIKKGSALVVNPPVAGNTFTKWLIASKDADASQYLVFAKSCEPNTIELYERWDETAHNYSKPTRDSVIMQQLVTEGTTLWNATKNNEIKLRYAYQVLRMSFYSGRFSQTLKLFPKLTAGAKRNVIYYRCLALKAGALYRTKRKAEAAYLFSQLFGHSDERRQMLSTSFSWCTDNKIEQVLALCKTPREKAQVYIMQALYGEESAGSIFDLMQEAYENDPEVVGLEIAATRAINMMEPEAIPGMATVRKGVHPADDMTAFVLRIAAEGKNKRTAYWYITAAYLYVLNGDAVSCKLYLGKASAKKLTAGEKEAHGMVSLLYTIRKNDVITGDIESEMLPALKKMEATPPDYNQHTENIFPNMMVTVLAAIYKEQGSLERRVYCVSKRETSERRDGYPGESVLSYFNSETGGILQALTHDELRTLESFVAKKNKTPFEKWLTDKTPFTKGMLRELEGTLFLRSYQFDSAVAVLSKVPDSILSFTSLPDVLVSHLVDDQLLNESDEAVSYNKLTFARRMVDLERKLKTDSANARAAYQYANALYSISYYGKAYSALGYFRSGADEHAYFLGDKKESDKQYSSEYYRVKLPEQYYMQAFRHTDDKELKARCLFMAAKCWQKNCPGTFNSWNPDQKAYYGSTWKNPYLKRLKSDYRRTKFFASATATCSYFEDYVKKSTN